MRRILAIDDEPSVTRMIKLNLEKTGVYEVQTANQPKSALAVAKKFQPDLILLDVIMPDMDGGDVEAQMRSDPGLRNVPIVYLTAIVSKQEAETKRLASGGNRFLAKPVSLKELLRCIRETLDGAAD